MASTSYQPSSSTTTYIAYGTNLSNSPSLRWVAVQIIPLGLFHAPAEFLQETVLGYDIWLSAHPECYVTLCALLTLSPSLTWYHCNVQLLTIPGPSPLQVGKHEVAMLCHTSSPNTRDTPYQPLSKHSVAAHAWVFQIHYVTYSCKAASVIVTLANSGTFLICHETLASEPVV